MIMNYERQNVLTPGTHPPFNIEKAINFFLYILTGAMRSTFSLFDTLQGLLLEV